MSMVKRNSSLESLRILSMLMILAHHYVMYNGYPVELMPFGINRFYSRLYCREGDKLVLSSSCQSQHGFSSMESDPFRVASIVYASWSKN